MWSNFPHSPCWQSLFGQVRTTKLPRDEQIVTCGDKLRTESLPLACRVTALWASVLVVLYVLAAHRRAGSELCGDAHQQALACLSRPSDVLQLHRHGLVHRLSGPTFSSFPEIHSPRRLGVVFFLAWKPMRRLSLGRPRVTGYAEMKVPPPPLAISRSAGQLRTPLWRCKRSPACKAMGGPHPRQVLRNSTAPNVWWTG